MERNTEVGNRVGNMEGACKEGGNTEVACT